MFFDFDGSAVRNYLKYTPPKKRQYYKKIGSDYKPYREVWQGLPVAPSRLKKVRDQEIYYCEAGGFTVVVPFRIISACRQNRNTILRVLVSRENGQKRIQGLWVFEGTLEDAIADANYWNYDDVSWGKGKRTP